VLPYGLGPIETPKGLKWLIIGTLCISFFTAIFDPIYEYFMNAPGLSFLFGLSREGLSSWYIWQPLTYLFFQSGLSDGLSFGFLLSLAINMYMLWIIGAELCDRLGTSRFIYYYVGSGALSGLVGIFFASFSYLLLGPWAGLIAIFTLWTMLNPEREVLFLFIIPIKIKWLFAVIAGGVLLISLSKLDFVSFFLTFAAVTIGYIYSTVAWQISSPFPFLHPVDHFFFRLGTFMNNRFFKNKAISPTKIYDLRTGQPPKDDDAFVDEMLAKIAKHGQEALSWAEKKRLDEIAEKRRHKDSF
jgi:membrane associated rhomboid family serine protease